MLKHSKDDKETRTNAISPIVESNRIILIDGGWNKMFLDQVCTFPLAKNDDIHDAFVYAVDDNLNNTKFNYGMAR
jgi:phage terminase large subunit-like protein